jgi:RNA polymerase sigma-70 factor (ECF subfamily)
MQSLPSDLTSKSLESQVASKQRFLHFCRATDTLSVEVKRVFLLKKVYGMSQRDIAEYIGLSQSTVEKHVAKGLLQCTLYLQQFVNSDTEQAAGAVKHSETVNK